MAHTMRTRSVASCAGARVEVPLMGPAPVALRRPVCVSHTGRVIGNIVARPSPLRLVPSVATAAASSPAAASTAPASQAPTQQAWYAVVANAEFFLNDVQNESVAEQLRERVRLFKEKGDAVNFWLVPNPTWLDAKFADKGKQVKRPCVALVSTDRIWINFMKLRLDRVLLFELGAVSEEEALASSAKLPEKFTPPAKWTAPYSRYTPGWWNVFIKDGSK